MPADARRARSDVQGFGGVTVGTATFGSAVSSTFGGRLGIGLTPNVQVFGEAGRLAGLESPTFDILDFTDIAVHLSALYAEGGIRFIALPRPVRPYAEATAGVARLNASFSGLNGRTDPIIGTALDLINATRRCSASAPESSSMPGGCPSTSGRYKKARQNTAVVAE